VLSPVRVPVGLVPLANAVKSMSDDISGKKKGGAYTHVSLRINLYVRSLEYNVPNISTPNINVYKIRP